MGSTFTQARDKATAVAHSVGATGATAWERTVSLARRASGHNGTIVDHAQHLAARTAQAANRTAQATKGRAAEAASRTRAAAGTFTARARHTLPDRSGASGRACVTPQAAPQRAHPWPCPPRGPPSPDRTTRQSSAPGAVSASPVSLGSRWARCPPIAAPTVATASPDHASARPRAQRPRTRAPSDAV